MQHYRTHMSPKSRRSQKRGLEETRPRPRLHAHHRIKSDPVRVEQPLTIDQHLNNYHRSLLSHTPNLPSPLKSALRKNSTSSSSVHSVPAVALQPSASTSSSSFVESSQPTSSRSSRSNSSSGHSGTSTPASPILPHTASPPSSVITLPHMFYQHKPLVYPAKRTSNTTPLAGRPAFLSTLLHPEIPTTLQKRRKNDDGTADVDDASGGLLQLAHIVSTFG